MNQTDMISAQIDTLGALLARIADLEAQAKAIKDMVKDAASMGDAKQFDGQLFRATYVEANRTTVDTKALPAALMALGVSPVIVAKAIESATKTSAVFSVRVVSR